jgi:ribosomal protein S18 acetylase RimI-like enzyme
MSNIDIIKVSLNDLENLQIISKITFFETFSAVNKAEDMAKYLNENLSLDKLNIELSDSISAFYFAVNNTKTIGYLKLNFGTAQTELKNEQSLEIERIYVLKEYHGKKIAQLLYDKAIQIAKEKNVNYVWLGVWEKNLRAINFFKKNEFVAFDKHIFKLGDDEQTDILMKLELVNN